MASDVNKPNGQHFIGPSEQQIRDFVHPLACRKISGIGRVTEKILQGALGVETVHDLYEKRAEAFYLFKPATAQSLMRASIGYSESVSNEDGDDTESLHRKGISHERTFSPTSSWNELCTKVETITYSLIHDLKERSLRPKTVTLKVKLSNFDIISKTSTRENALFQSGNIKESSQDLVDIVLKLLKEAKSIYSSNHHDTFSVRLLGVRCSNFHLTKDTQLSLDRYYGIHSPKSLQKQPQSRCPFVNNPYKTSPKRCKDSQSVINHTATSPLPQSVIENSPGSTETEVLICPICGTSIQSSSNNNNAINAHIDACLNAKTVKQLAKEETLYADLNGGKPKKKRSLADFFNT